MNVTFCITCKNRTQHLKLTLPQNIRDNPGAHFVLLNYGTQDDLMKWVLEEETVYDAIKSHVLNVYTYSYEGPFRMAHAKNMAHRLAIMEGADLLVNLDADNFTGADFAGYCKSMLAPLKNTFLAIGPIVPGVTPRGLSGRIAVTKNAFLKLGGYDERFEDWGADDKDFNKRLQRCGYEAQIIPDRFMTCVRHNDRMRFKEYPHVATTTHCEHQKLVDTTNTIANWGNFGWMHKTGTTSLHQAFKILGYNAAHWTSAHWAKKLWREMNTEGKSLTLEKHYALSDMPIGNLFRKLDEAYPGSKFILTTRNEDAWINSVRRHYNPNHNAWRPNWENDPFTNIIHKHTYGITTFNEQIMRERFRRHNSDVIMHFRNRPKDLLVLTDAQTSWDKLCFFLNETTPTVPYPRVNFSA
jgi:hypothetical protein